MTTANTAVRQPVSTYEVNLTKLRLLAATLSLVLVPAFFAQLAVSRPSSLTVLVTGPFRVVMGCVIAALTIKTYRRDDDRLDLVNTWCSILLAMTLCFYGIGRTWFYPTDGDIVAGVIAHVVACTGAYATYRVTCIRRHPGRAIFM